jgi:hypothetical protein
MAHLKEDEEEELVLMIPNNNLMLINLFYEQFTYSVTIFTNIFLNVL